MRYCSLAISFAFSVAAITAVANLPPQLENKALPKVEVLKAAGHSPIELVKDGKINFAIVGEFAAEEAVRGPGDTPLKKFGRDSVRQAAHLLADVFGKTVGERPQIFEAGDPKAKAYPFVIALGETSYSRALGVKPLELPREGFEVRTTDKAIVIAGMDGFRIPGMYDIYNWKCLRITCNGTLMGAIDFAERFLGVRKFTNRQKDLWHVYPKVSHLSVPACAYRDHPRYWTRWPMRENWRSGVSSDFFGGEAPSPFVLSKAHPDKIETIFYRDSSGRLWHDEKEYGGNFLDVSNNKLADILVEDFKRYYETEGADSYWNPVWAPSTRYLWFGQCDKSIIFDNERVRSMQRKNPSACSVMSEVYSHFHNYLAKRCQEEFPGRTLVLMAYHEFLMPPKTIERFPDNVQMLICHGTPALIGSARYRKLVTAFYDAWNKKCAPDKKGALYTYDLSATQNTVFPTMLRGYFEGEFLKHVRPYSDPHNIYTCLTRGIKEGEFPNVLSAHLVFRALWNPDYDADAGMEDFYRLAFGEKSAESMIAIYRLILKRWREDYIPKFEKGPLFKQTMDKLQCFRSIPYTEIPVFHTTTMDAPTLDAIEKYLASAEAALPQEEVYRRRFAEYSTHVRRSIESARMYTKFANSASFVIGREKTEIPRLNSYAITGKVAPRGSRTWMRRGNDGLYISHWSRYAPFGAEGPKDKCAYVDLLLAPGEAPSNVYRISLYANGSVYDCRRQLDPPRAPDDKYDVKGLKLESKADDAARLWTFEAFVPWSAFDEGAPKAGEKWRMNVLGANPIGEKGYGISSIAPTMGDPWRAEFYGLVTFE